MTSSTTPGLETRKHILTALRPEARSPAAGRAVPPGGSGGGGPACPQLLGAATSLGLPCSVHTSFLPHLHWHPAFSLLSVSESLRGTPATGFRAQPNRHDLVLTTLAKTPFPSGHIIGTGVRFLIHFGGYSTQPTAEALSWVRSVSFLQGQTGRPGRLVPLRQRGKRGEVYTDPGGRGSQAERTAHAKALRLGPSTFLHPRSLFMMMGPL